MKTVTILIGGSDNGRTLTEWANFAADVKRVFVESHIHLHFHGGSDWDSSKRMGCFVAEVEEGAIAALLTGIAECRRVHRQDEVTVLVAEPEFI